MEKYYGVLEYRNKKSKFKKILQGPQGVGFKLTNDGNYDIDNKKLVNVHDPENDKDVVNYNSFLNTVFDFRSKFLDYNQQLIALKTKIDGYGNSIEELIENLENFKKEQKILNDYVRLNIYNKVFIGVATNVNITNQRNVVEFEKVVSSNNIKILQIKIQKFLFFANEGYYRLNIQFYCSIKLNPSVFITLNGNSEKVLIDHKKLSFSDIIKEVDKLSLKTLTLTFYTPKDDSLRIYIYQEEKVLLDELRIIIERIY